MNNTFDDPILSREETADALDLSTRTLDRQTDLPRVRLSARRVGYRKSDVQARIARKTSLPVGISPTPSDMAFAALRSTIGELIVLDRASPEQARQFVESAVRGIYGAGAALNLPLPEIHLSPVAP